jgi:nicotinamide-nucleotide amidase
MTGRPGEVEIVVIGEELLSGATVDTNAAHIARELERIGIQVARKTTVGDAPTAISDVVAAALARTGAVITTGGLGPTKDDATKAAVAGVFGRELVFREELWGELRARYGQDVPVPETNRSQAEVPEAARVFPNPRGTAPGLALEDENRLCILLPGVPGEMRAILRDSVLPFLAGRAGGTGVRPFRRQLRTAGIAEAAIAESVGDRLDDLPLEVAYLPEIDGVDIRLTRRASVEDEAREALDEGERRLREILGVHIYGTGDDDLARVVGDLLRERGLRIVVAESCTAGLVAKRLTDWPGSSDYFWGGMVVYDDGAKTELLGVSERTLAEHGAVSEPVVRAMAEGACDRSGVVASIAVTGIAGPGGGTEEKPVGTVWIAARLKEHTVAKRRRYPGARDMVRARAAQGALVVLRRLLLSPE